MKYLINHILIDADENIMKKGAKAPFQLSQITQQQLQQLLALQLLQEQT